MSGTQERAQSTIANLRKANAISRAHELFQRLPPHARIALRA
ncbi:hypothetical protein [Lysobacter gummosus]